MIYCIPIENYPKENQFLEELSYKDENSFEWKIARVENGLIVKYFGDEYFKNSTFEIELKSGKWIRIKNTNCIFFKDSDFEDFCNIRDILKNGYTDEIWETFNDLFTERFENCLDILVCERL
jgi:hypothetical protein